jgi:hypothetical protein
MVYQIAALSLEADIHLYAIAKTIQELKCGVVFHHIASDWISRKSLLAWKLTDTLPTASISNIHGDIIDIGQMDLVWWRRVNQPQASNTAINDPTICDLINRDCGASLLGAFQTCFNGVWVSDPMATLKAENKLLQLKTALSCGFRVPKTLVSQDPATIRDFCTEHDNNLIIKPVRGTLHKHLFTRKLESSHLESTDALRMCPATYQECIEGDRHLRVMCFGSNVHTFLITTSDLDWRENTNVPFEYVSIGSEFDGRVISLVETLGLKMGVLDFKLDQHGEPIWLEINPQGQFLFCEGMTGFDLQGAFVKFLMDELNNKG